MPRVIDWGRVEYVEALGRMRSLVLKHRSGSIEDTLVMVEHPPVVTVGVEGDDGSAARTGLPVVAVDRGGKSTYHGPGQLVGYPIVDLAQRNRDVRRFVHDLEGVIIDSLREFGVRGEHVSGRRGVWVDGQRKIASIGIAVDHWVTYHGFALNVDVDLSAFASFHPCGFDGNVMTSLRKELGRPIDLAEVRPIVAREWTHVFAPPIGPPLPPA